MERETVMTYIIKNIRNRRSKAGQTKVKSTFEGQQTGIGSDDPPPGMRVARGERPKERARGGIQVGGRLGRVTRQWTHGS